MAEVLHDFVANTLVDATGKEGMKFFPLVFSLFMFVLTANLLGMIPGFFTVTSHIIVTFALAMLVIGTVVVYGFMSTAPTSSASSCRRACRSGSCPSSW